MKVTLPVHVILLLVLLVEGCASQHPKDRVIARDNRFMVVEKQKKDTLASLAMRYLGNSAYASVLARYNPSLQDASYIAIPTTAVNPSGVHNNGIQQVPVLCYHQFTSAERSNNRMVVTQAEFTAQMQYLHENQYQVISLDEFNQFIQGQREVPEKAVVITVDDGFRSYLDIAVPILRRFDMPSTIFVYPDFIGGGLALSWQDLVVMSDDPLVDVQSHSKSHGNLGIKKSNEDTQQYRKRLYEEVVVAQQQIEQRGGNDNINYFAYPYGNTSPQLIEQLENSHYKLGLTVERGSNPAFSHHFLINRTMIYGGASMAAFKRSLDTFKQVNLQ